jgi:outer membrane protein TolC
VLVWLLIVACALGPQGCSFGEKRLHYIGEPEPEEVVDPQFNIVPPPEPEETVSGFGAAGRPRTIAVRQRDEIWDLSLVEAIHLALINNRVARTRNDFLSPGNQLLLSPDSVVSVYDPAIRDTGFLFGTKGVESALSVFDPIFSTNLNFGTNSTLQNNPITSGGIPPGTPLNQDTSQAVMSLTKTMAYGATAGVAQTWTYNSSNQPFQLFNSLFTGNIQFTYNQPLLAGAGTDFARISGPVANSIQGVSGLNQGVVIARINTDISLLDFETQVRNMVHDVEDLYWELYLAYQNYHSLVSAQNAARKLWETVNAKAATGLPGGGRAEEAQARESYFESRARVEAALAGPAGRGGEQGIYGVELQLRRICGLPTNDGKIIRPSDEPSIAQVVPHWDISLATAYTRRQELRKQKWNIKSLELQLQAAHNLNRPQLNFVSNYEINGFGRLLFAPNGTTGTIADTLQNYTRDLYTGNQTGWNLGLQFAMPLGLRNAHAQVRNTELRLIKAKSALDQQEQEVSHELAATFQAVDYWWQNMQTNYNRRQAAADNLDAAKNDYDVERKPLDLVLQAQNRLTIAEVSFYRSVVEYNKTLAELQLRQGTLLEYNHVHLAERDWDPEAKLGARELARARSHALDAFSFDPVYHEPEAFVPRQVGLPPFQDAPDVMQIPDVSIPSADVSRAERRLPPKDAVRRTGGEPSADVSRAERRLPPRDADTGSATVIPKLPPAGSDREP